MTSVSRRPPGQSDEAHGDSGSVVSARFVAKWQPSSGNVAEEYSSGNVAEEYCIYPHERDPCVKLVPSVKFSLASHVSGAGWREDVQGTSRSFGTAAIWGRVSPMGDYLVQCLLTPRTD